MSATTDQTQTAADPPGDVGSPAAESAKMRIGEVAELTGTTPRTIRYYEELGLLGSVTDREQGKHRCYSDADVERIKEIVRLKELLGLSLEQLSELVEAETARAEIRREYHATDDRDRQATLLTQSLSLIGTQLRLVHERIEELGSLEASLLEKQEHVTAKLRQLG